MSFFLKSAFRHLRISLIILTPIMFCLYFCFDLLGFSFLKIQSALLQTGLRALFRLVGWECLGPVMILLCVVSGLGGSTLHMMDPSGSHSGAASSSSSSLPSLSTASDDWIEKTYGKQDETSSSAAPKAVQEQREAGPYNQPLPVESSEASVNQQPVIPELEPPVLDDNTRRAELDGRLRANWWGIAYNERILDSFVRTQLKIEKHIEAALVDDGYSRQVVFEKRHQIRGFLFYPNGRALSENAYAGYLNQILNLGTRQSVPYRRVIGAIHHYDLFFER